MLNPQIVFKFCIEPQTCHAQCFRTNWAVPTDLPYFNGHFPEQPILPAVAMVDASVEMLRQALQIKKLDLKVVKSAKFMEPILPGHEVEINLHQVSEKEWSTDWKKPTGAILARISFGLT